MKYLSKFSVLYFLCNGVNDLKVICDVICVA